MPLAGITTLFKALQLLLLSCVCCLLATPVRAETVPVEQARELKNRFRIDHMVDSLTLVIQRDYGSAPVVVVLPDGSKWYANRHPDTVRWTDGVTGDIITIENPEPGPWQLVGKVTEGSKLLMLSKLSVQIDPLPQPLFQGERVKITARLMGDNERLRMPGLDYLVEWTARFISDHQPGDENFATGTVTVGSYKDDGEGLDGRPDDGIFTGKINLNQPWGHYKFLVRARNNVFEREQETDIVLSPHPIELKLIEPEDPLTGRYKLGILVNTESLSLPETLLELELVGPAGLQLPMTISEMAEGSTEFVLPEVHEFGSYRIKGDAFATTLDGREIVLSLPEQFFNLIEPPAPPPSPEEIAAREAAIAAAEEAKAKESAMYLLIGVNVVLLLLGVGALIFWRKRQALKKALAAAAAEAAAKDAPEKGMKETLDDIDLTLPDD
ncbi:TIGR03503 family protein [Shewanella sp. 3B26]|uniref:TIGR03503 family protein n=1 Tax=Shewanella zhuhaiensis TaxID=2919576 RepID=A0AAJ1BGP3_9GAMM|nr:TIGR03503 family protein [Shewanella zhuhaiensis]MCH4294330.1 TIGR03503 family protein [Shewanella zhuhaiensis]